MKKIDIELYDDNRAGGFFNDKEIDISFEIDFALIRLKIIKGCPTYVPYGNDSILYDDGVYYEVEKDCEDFLCSFDYVIEDGSRLSAEDEKELLSSLNKLVFDYLNEQVESCVYDSVLYKEMMREE